MTKRLIFAAIMLLLAGGLVQAAQPLDLRGVCKLTVQKNPALVGAGASVAQSEAALKKARGMLLPSVTARSSYGYITKPTFFNTVPILETNTVINRIEVVQPIYSGGQLHASAQAADYAVRAAGGTQAAVRSEVVTNSAVAYLRALEARDAVTVAQSSVNALESSHDAARKLFDSGVVTNADVLRAEVALTTAKAQLIAAENGYATAVAALRVAIGLPQSEEIELTTGVEDSALAGVESLPVRTRAEVEAAGFGVKAADSRVRAARGAKAPNVGMMVDFENQPVGSQFPRLSNTAMVGLQIKLNVFDGGQTRADIEQAKASKVKAQADLDSMNQAAAFQLEAARLAVTSARAQVDTLATQVKSAEESFRVVETGYKEAINVINDVLSVESSLTGARVSKMAADYDLRIAQLNLLLAIGQTDRLTN
jgi:outer membrane protein